MSLNNNLRGLLENIIDESIIIMPALMTLFRNTIPPEFGIQRLEDYAFGYVQGLILGQFISSYRSYFCAKSTTRDILGSRKNPSKKIERYT